MRLAAVVAVCLLAGPALVCRAQFVRPPVIVRPPVVMPRVQPPHVYVPHSSNGNNHSSASEDWSWLLWALGGVGVVAVVGWYLIRTPAAGRRSRIHIIAMPPGEAPVSVRAAWVGLELPLIAGPSQPSDGAAQQVLSGRGVSTPDSYAVDGASALAVLEAEKPEAAKWWRANAPHVFAAGYQLVFPAAVCVRLDD